MSSLAPSSSVLPAVALAHSYNSRGELGMFVNPYACSCVTCVNHVATERMPEPLPLLAPPSSPLTRLEAVGVGTGAGGSGDPLGPTASYWVDLAHSSSLPDAEPAAGFSNESPAQAAAPARSLTFSMGISSAAAEPLSLDDETANRLRFLRARLQGRQDHVYDRETRSHDEMAAQDAEFNELDTQILAIEDLLRSFGLIYRQR